MNFLKRIFYNPFFIRLLHWEYWPFSFVYGPILIIWVWLSIRARSFFFFSASNPSIFSGGFLMESKNDIYKIIPQQYYPQTIYCKTGIALDKLTFEMSKQNFSYPLIAKPDIGAKGRGVRKVNNEYELIDYAKTSQLDFLVQEFIPYPFEAGIFYCRYPNEEKGFISGIVSKELLSVTGDGKSTIYQLINKEKRYILQLDALQAMYGAGLLDVLPSNTTKILMPYGNHARGSKFIDVSYLIDDKLTETIDQISKQINGFYFGRLDVKFNSWDELKEGKHFSIIEINGTGSEPTHMYDPKHSIFFAWKEIVRHWIIMWRISKQNHQQGVAYMTTKEGLQMFKDDKAFEKKLAALYV